MFLKTKNKTDGTEVNIMIDKIVSFAPLGEDKGAGSTVLTSTGVSFSVEASTRTIRSQIGKLYGTDNE
jgi:hypothetical protein